MKLDSEQKGVARGAGFAAVFSAVFLVVGYLWFPFELGAFERPAARLVFALKANIFVFLWLVAAVGRVANIRFFSCPSRKLTLPRRVRFRDGQLAFRYERISLKDENFIRK